MDNKRKNYFQGCTHNRSIIRNKNAKKNIKFENFVEEVINSEISLQLLSNCMLNTLEEDTTQSVVTREREKDKRKKNSNRNSYN